MSDTISVFQSEGFQNVDGTYDIILANLPIVHSETDPARFDFGLLDEYWMLHDHFLSEYKNFLIPGGKAVICHTPLQKEWCFNRLEQYLMERGATFEKIFEESRNGTPWRLYALS